MKKVVSILSVIVCITAISVNIMIQTNNEFGEFDLKLLNLQAMAQGEIEPLDEWTESVYNCPVGSTKSQGRNCLPVANGSPSCFLVLCN